jgi:hypothetical protein
VTTVEDILSSVPKTQKVLLSQASRGERHKATWTMPGGKSLEDSSSRYVHSSKHTPEQDPATTPIMPDSFAKRKRKIQAAERAAATGKPNASLSSRERRLAKSVVGVPSKTRENEVEKKNPSCMPKRGSMLPCLVLPWGIFHVPSCPFSPPRISLIRRPAARIYHGRCPYQACPAH